MGGVGSAGYDLAGWDGSVGDYAYTPNASISLIQGSRYQWAEKTIDARALSDPSQQFRNAAAYISPTQVRVSLSFTAAYSGTVHLYAVDWDKQGRRETITVNGQTAVLSSDFSAGAWVALPVNVPAGGTVTITVDRTAGPNAVLSGIFLGNEGAPPAVTVSSPPQGNWVSQVGTAGYLLADWDGAQDLSNLPGVSATLVQGSRYQWAANASDVRALQAPDGGTTRNAAAYTATQVRVSLSFTAAYSGTVHLYAVDWDKQGRRETITVNGQTAVLSSDFSAGAWVALPVNVPAGGTVTITVDRTAGPNAVLSGIFLGNEGAPPAVTVSSPPQGNWVSQVGTAGYLLADWDGAQDLSNLPGVSATLVQGSRYQWAANASDVRALQAPDGGTTRNAAAYTATQVRVSLSFTAAYSGTVHLYAVDWDKQGRRETITVNGQTAVLSSDFSAGAWVALPVNVPAGGTVTITVDRTAGPNAVLSGIFLGNEGAPPAVTVSSPPQGNWVSQVGTAGYDLAGWEGSTGDLVNMPNVSVTLAQGTRYRWSGNTTDVRALSDPTQLTRRAAAYIATQVRVSLSFTAAYSGTVHLYAVDWDKQGRRETITVNGQTAVLSSDFSAGAWVALPVNVPAGGTVTITVDRTAGPNAVLSGILLG